jgi:hypothetical protein
MNELVTCSAVLRLLAPFAVCVAVSSVSSATRDSTCIQTLAETRK